MTVSGKNPFKINDHVVFNDVRKLPLQRSDVKGQSTTPVKVMGVVTAIHGEKLTIDISNTIPYSAKKHYDKTCEASFTLCDLDVE